jgi:hypothetical protein
MIRRNMGGADRAVRFVVGVALLPIGLFVLSGLAGIVAVVLAVVALATSLTGYCPGYVPFGISTLGRDQGPTKAA